ncbi:MAG: hypothetical protein IT378_27780 [Sandaracinaceae bacterium]|nr:hypothetical protein [Sandaracinaceae bacterium]
MDRKLVFVVSMMAAWASGCVREHRIGLVLGGVPDGARVDVEIHEGGSCELLLLAGVGVRAPIESVRSDASGALPPLPALGPGSYSVFVRARDRVTCRSAGIACREVDVATATTVELSLAPPGAGAAGCGPSQRCDNGDCVIGGPDAGSACAQDVPCPGLDEICCDNQCRPSADCACGGDCNTAGSSSMCCGGECADVSNDPSHCGRCGNGCASGVCAEGMCSGDTSPPALRLTGLDPAVAGRATIELQWFQLEALEPPLSATILTRSLDGSESEVSIALDEVAEPGLVPTDAMKLCAREPGCAGGAAGCRCVGPAYLAFALARAIVDGQVWWFDVVLVRASASFTRDEVVTFVGDGYGLAELFQNGGRQGLWPYRPVTSTAGTLQLQLATFDEAFSLRPCTAGECRPPLEPRAP